MLNRNPEFIHQKVQEKIDEFREDFRQFVQDRSKGYSVSVMQFSKERLQFNKKIQVFLMFLEQTMKYIEEPNKEKITQCSLNESMNISVNIGNFLEQPAKLGERLICASDDYAMQQLKLIQEMKKKSILVLLCHGAHKQNPRKFFANSKVNGYNT